MSYQIFKQSEKSWKGSVGDGQQKGWDGLVFEVNTFLIARNASTPMVSTSSFSEKTIPWDYGMLYWSVPVIRQTVPYQVLGC